MGATKSELPLNESVTDGTISWLVSYYGNNDSDCNVSLLQN